MSIGIGLISKKYVCVASDTLTYDGAVFDGEGHIIKYAEKNSTLHQKIFKSKKYEILGLVTGTMELKNEKVVSILQKEVDQVELKNIVTLELLSKTIAEKIKMLLFKEKIIHKFKIIDIILVGKCQLYKGDFELYYYRIEPNENELKCELKEKLTADDEGYKYIPIGDDKAQKACHQYLNVNKAKVINKEAFKRLLYNCILDGIKNCGNMKEAIDGSPSCGGNPVIFCI